MLASENVCPNINTTPTKRRRTRFSIESQQSRQSSKNNSPMCSPLNSSSDGEWSKFQAELNTVKEQSKLYENDSVSDGSILSEYDSPNQANDLESQRKTLELMKKNLEINEEMRKLYDEQNEMIEYFKYQLVDITRARILAECNKKGKKAQDIDTNGILEALDLRRTDPMNLTEVLQGATEALLI
ncbi:hypothetical protein TVAG_245990 [Trichomonas vaginalis G3]|uniref:Uncharacterized protein n=1 Tax=Trichomonas vaginalis (strain ATCC PRA-98 / G3) TaxID=412133 RepID=A2E4Q7_TRIV3|nr:hypothetical protein TVAGG3_0862580 [Trichomonas vaginalis G3]EAY12367.1 hypothetical protein TVAG_245990 [Trichomonas vaginalis G3]KAI5500785.1 hypothetical protein TVAGG3_0862580 [Trichomonas vaginalis G3]|eukprot:XP_001324590.1 hypothetical protein [Trichomonas vaginalis G3]